MSDRRRRFETSWNKKEDQSSLRWSNSEVNDDMVPSNHSGRSSWDPLQGNKNRPKGDDISRDRHRMQTDPNIDERGKQYSNRPSHDRSWDRRDRDRDRPRSPYRSRNLSRSRSRSRNRDWESGRSRSKSPLCDDDRDRDRDEYNEYPNIRNNSRLSSQSCKDIASQHGGGGNQVDNSHNLTGSWSQRPGGSRDDDGHRDNRDNWNRNTYDGQDSRRHSHQNTRVAPCRYFSAGKCNRDDCKYSHDSGNLVSKNNRWQDQQPHDDLNPKPSFGERKKSWNGPSWDDVDSGAFDNTRGRPSDDKSKSWDDKKKMSDGPSFDDVRKSDSDLDNKNRSRNYFSSDGAPGYPNVSKPSHYSDSNKSWKNNASSAMSDKADGKTKKWSGPLWDEVSESGYTDVRKSSGGDMSCSVLPLQMDNNIRKWDRPKLNETAYKKQDHCLPQGTSVTGLQSHTLDVQEQHVMPQALAGQYCKVSTALTPEVCVASSDLVNVEKISEDANHQILTSLKDSVNNLNSQSLSYSNGTEQSQVMLPFSEPKFPLNTQVEGAFLHMSQTENKNNEVSKPPNPSDIVVPQAINEFTPLPVSLPKMSPKGQLPQLYSDLNLSNAIDFLKSLPSSAYNQDTKKIEKHNSEAASMDAKTVLPNISGSEKQVCPPTLTDKPTSTAEIGETRVMEKSPKAKKQELIKVAASANQEQEITNPDKVDEGDISVDEKAMRLFKVALVEFVKEILKPKWKEGKMSREVHKNVVKKVVEKVTSSIQGTQIPRTQAKIDQYLACSKPKITKLVEAYVERLLKA